MCVLCSGAWKASQPNRSPTRQSHRSVCWCLLVQCEGESGLRCLCSSLLGGAAERCSGQQPEKGGGTGGKLDMGESAGEFRATEKGFTASGLQRDEVSLWIYLLLLCVCVCVCVHARMCLEGWGMCVFRGDGVCLEWSVCIERRCV